MRRALLALALLAAPASAAAPVRLGRGTAALLRSWSPAGRIDALAASLEAVRREEERDEDRHRRGDPDLPSSRHGEYRRASRALGRALPDLLARHAHRTALERAPSPALAGKLAAAAVLASIPSIRDSIGYEKGWSIAGGEKGGELRERLRAAAERAMAALRRDQREPLDAALERLERAAARVDGFQRAMDDGRMPELPELDATPERIAAARRRWLDHQVRAEPWEPNWDEKYPQTRQAVMAMEEMIRFAVRAGPHRARAAASFDNLTDDPEIVLEPAVRLLARELGELTRDEARHGVLLIAAVTRARPARARAAYRRLQAGRRPGDALHDAAEAMLRGLDDGGDEPFLD